MLSFVKHQERRGLFRVRQPGQEAPRCLERDNRFPIAGELVALLERRRKARAIGDRLSEWIFHRDGRRILEFRKSWSPACKRAGCSKLFHDLRRSAVRDMIRSGVPQSVAMDISGHKTVSMFKRYNITDQRDKAAAFERLGEYHESAAKKVIAMEGNR